MATSLAESLALCSARTPAIDFSAIIAALRRGQRYVVSSLQRPLWSLPPAFLKWSRRERYTHFVLKHQRNQQLTAVVQWVGVVSPSQLTFDQHETLSLKFHCMFVRVRWFNMETTLSTKWLKSCCWLAINSKEFIFKQFLSCKSVLFINQISVVVLTFKQCFQVNQVCFIHVIKCWQNMLRNMMLERWCYFSAGWIAKSKPITDQNRWLFTTGTSTVNQC